MSYQYNCDACAWTSKEMISSIAVFRHDFIETHTENCIFSVKFFSKDIIRENYTTSLFRNVIVKNEALAEML